MAFTDLPDDWGSRPITDPTLTADVLDLLVSEQCRHRGGLVLLFCDASDRLVAPIEVTPLPSPSPEAVERSTRLGDLVSSVVAHPASARLAGAGVLVALARPGLLSVSPDDACWADAVALATRNRVRLLGIHLVTQEGSRPVPSSRLAA
jgi:hypothetical protein